MAVLLFKILSIAVKTLARPLINWVTYYNRLKLQESQHKTAFFIKERLIWTGQTINYYNILLNRKIFGLTKETKEIRPLTNDKALERGAEFFSELFVYSIILTLPIIEMIKSYKNNKLKEKKKKDFLIQMQSDTDSCIEKNIEITKSLVELKESLVRLDREIYLV